MLFVLLICIYIYLLSWIPVHFLPLAAIYTLWVPQKNLYLKEYMSKIARKCFEFTAINSTYKNNRQTVYALYPHAGLLAVTCSAYFGPLDVTIATSSLLFYLPVIKELLGVGGCIPATKKRIKQALDAGESVVLCADGIRGMNGLDEERKRLGGGVVRRPGFIRLVVEHPKLLALVPVWAPDEHTFFTLWIPWPAIQRRLLSWIWWTGPVFIWPTGNRSGQVVFGRPFFNEDYRHNSALLEKKFYDELLTIKKFI